ncbi:type III pantothenate kinase [Arenicella xantha]|uniref:Type III pantothenate kinase n=1 Tax=Arenicella xantha TaxID=644221 RepID=A0A395JI07_9GAMM|nr:type III pantothenate kinase [Arenicella xantha]RBP49780.1 type III pantothenate kinase [Arenicella xantha]
MRLFIDIGNTRTKWLLMDGDLPVRRGAIDNSQVDQIDLGCGKAVSRAWASCVAQEEIFQRLASIVEADCGVRLNRAAVESSVNHMVNAYLALDRLGVDRWLAALGARDLIAAGDLVVIDAGTAVTVDLVSAKHCFEGGVILPGARMMHDALVGRTVGIISERSEVDSVVGRTTQECVNAGALYGLAGAIERIVLEMQKRLLHTDKLSVLLCGGDAERLAAVLPDHYRVELDLVFYGLQVIDRAKS